ncbi:MAG: helix-turn-helix domain-containing protein [Alphaproteobacteria bacterium]|nr:helix-turn-helix domain-containing protein [Alphaproteobacteria bacterium]
MREKDRKAKARATWLEAYNVLSSVSKAAIRCGIARSTLYRWLKRAKNEQNLPDYSHRPKKLAHQKINSKLEMLILCARQNFGFGPQRIAIYLLRKHSIHLSSSTIWRLLKKAAVKPLKRYLSPRKPKRYSRGIPGERVQMDVTKIRPKCYQFTAVDVAPVCVSCAYIQQRQLQMLCSSLVKY